MAVVGARRPRSGTHRRLRNGVWWYRRGVPPDARAAFGCVEVTFSLHTSNEIEATRVEKLHDADFERRLQRARDDADPDSRRTRIAQDIIDTTPARYLGQWGVAYVPAEDREAVRAVVEAHYEARDAHTDEIHRLVYEIEQVLPRSPLAPETWQACRDDILSAIRHRVGLATNVPVIDPPPPMTFDWSYEQWRKLKNRPPQTVSEARKHLDEFAAHSGLTRISDVRRMHLLAWRDELVKPLNNFAAGTINQRLLFVSAILRAGWRDAEINEPNLTAIMVPQPDDSDRGSWQRADILTALQNLEPHSWAAWVFLISLTTAVRLGEPMAARVDWYERSGFITVTRQNRGKTKGRKLHALPIIECLREPLSRHVVTLPGPGAYLFNAPRANNPALKVSHEASKWFTRFFAKHRIDRVFHELRDTWIEGARHTRAVKKELWEIISGHSKATVSDRYGGEKPEVLAEANEEICATFLTNDPEIRAAMMRLVA